MTFEEIFRHFPTPESSSPDTQSMRNFTLYNNLISDLVAFYSVMLKNWTLVLSSIGTVGWVLIKEERRRMNGRREEWRENGREEE